jgi:CrcB protein
VTTGFLGGLTTFSAFSGEAAALLGQQQYGWFAALIAAHVAGSILMTIAGMVTVRTCAWPLARARHGNA